MIWGCAAKTEALSMVNATETNDGFLKPFKFSSMRSTVP